MYDVRTSKHHCCCGFCCEVVAYLVLRHRCPLQSLPRRIHCIHRTLHIAPSIVCGYIVYVTGPPPPPMMMFAVFDYVVYHRRGKPDTLYSRRLRRRDVYTHKITRVYIHSHDY